ncbi:hypothetical protein TNCV_4827591 [Trichonephila clavipes]|uniref:Uncharacterized protein n=1 Tax=Trichonephila clavipes TaxID=2585209 RepID=A0A8X6VPG8_TRICX|nr:hypothetical protein TNCV_4827591 [Trichonephila clavipes]
MNVFSRCVEKIIYTAAIAMLAFIPYSGSERAKGHRALPMKIRSYGSLVFKVTDSWLTCHKLEPGTTEDSSCKGGQCMLNVSRLKRPSVGVVWKLGEGVPTQVSSSSLDHGSE